MVLISRAVVIYTATRECLQYVEWEKLTMHFT